MRYQNLDIILYNDVIWNQLNLNKIIFSVAKKKIKDCTQKLTFGLKLKLRRIKKRKYYIKMLFNQKKIHKS